MYTQHNSESAHTVSFLIEALGDYPAGIDPDFDAELDDLEREWAELRMHFNG